VIAMEFCPKCGIVLVSKKENEKANLVCRKCGHKVKDYKPIEIKEDIKENPMNDVILMNEKKETLPKTEVICPKCNNKEATWWMQQTRSADEPPTLFFRCTKCQHSWREY
jgi:DNA-directed RNA polymerase subunit M